MDALVQWQEVAGNLKISQVGQLAALEALYTQTDNILE